jgi:hypothetical protein
MKVLLVPEYISKCFSHHSIHINPQFSSFFLNSCFLLPLFQTTLFKKQGKLLFFQTPQALLALYRQEKLPSPLVLFAPIPVSKSILCRPIKKISGYYIRLLSCQTFFFAYPFHTFGNIKQKAWAHCRISP